MLGEPSRSGRAESISLGQHDHSVASEGRCHRGVERAARRGDDDVVHTGPSTGIGTRAPAPGELDKATLAVGLGAGEEILALGISGYHDSTLGCRFEGHTSRSGVASDVFRDDPSSGVAVLAGQSHHRVRSPPLPSRRAGHLVADRLGDGLDSSDDHHLVGGQSGFGDGVRGDRGEFIGAGQENRRSTAVLVGVGGAAVVVPRQAGGHEGVGGVRSGDHDQPVEATQRSATSMSGHLDGGGETVGPLQTSRGDGTGRRPIHGEIGREI